ncbi:hypothetical protein BaRGS_00016618 [Batillaria attramentaria]|uniref:Uncharacterized protein n=1 Tax=Batillaria attramentaria TaxID=370345 RepID=A0ABD0KZC1_9CAEN
MRRREFLDLLVLAAFLQFGLVVPPGFCSTGTGSMTNVPIDCDTVRAVQCTADVSTRGFDGLTVYGSDNTDGSLVSFKISTKKCESGTQPASCVINDHHNTVALNVFLTDLTRGEERQYSCVANYFDRVAWTKAFYTNVSVPRRGTTKSATQSTTEESSRPTPSEADNRESNDSKGNAVNVTGIAIGAAVTFVVMATIMAIWRCRHKCPALCTSCSSPLPSRPTSQHGEWEICAVDDDLPPELPARNPGNHYRRKSSLPGMPGPVQEVPEPNGEYLTPVFKAPPMPTDPPEKHNFRQPQESGSTHYEVVN